MLKRWFHRARANCGVALAAALALACGGHVAAAPSIDEIIAMLPPSPRSLGRPIDDRQAWDPLADTQAGRRAIERAAEAVKKPVAEFDPDLYQEYFQTGNRSRYQAHESRRWSRLQILALGELLENRGRFVDGLEQTIASLCRGPSWVLPAHDRNAAIFHGKIQYVDLGASMRGHDMAVVYSLFGNRLSEATRALIRENLQRRVIEPTFRAMRATDDDPLLKHHAWRRATHNWNAVCTAGTTGVILTMVESPRERAEAVAEALANMERYLAGFTDDGYCSEGLGYWSYGFSHFAALRQILLEQTGGQIDLLDRPKARAAARFPLEICILDDVYPAFADCGLNSRPDGPLMRYLGWQAAPAPESALLSSGSLNWTMISLFNSTAGTQPDEPSEDALNTWFDQGQVMIARPSDATQRRFAVALKAGHNAEHHNHNDVGSYVVVLDGQPLLADPGSMVYTASTFSSERYRFAIMNSYGHAVPMINRKLQKPGADARARILALERTDATDRLSIDLAACYDDPTLASLHRTWTYDRRGNGQLTVSDHATFHEPGEFETALVGAADWRAGEDGELYVLGTNGAALRIDVVCDQPYDVRVEQLENPDRFEPVRVGLRLLQPALEAQVTFVISPAPAAEAATAQPLDISRKLLTVDENH